MEELYSGLVVVIFINLFCILLQMHYIYMWHEERKQRISGRKFEHIYYISRLNTIDNELATIKNNILKTKDA